jgi:anti-anti-sigma factor
VAKTGDDLTVRERDGVTIVRFNLESLLGADVEHLTDRIRTLIDGADGAGGTRKLVLDFKHVRYAASAALGMIMSLSKTMQRLGGKLALAHTERLGELLKVTNTERLFLIAPDAKTAVEMLNAKA